MTRHAERLEASGEASPLLVRARRWIGFLVGLALLLAACWAVAKNAPGLANAYDAAKAAPAWLVALVLALPLANWLAVSAGFWVLTRRHGTVAPTEMAALIGSAWLLNYLPMKPGLVGRFAYHKRVNHIALADSARVLAWAVALSGVALALLLAAAASLRLGLGVWILAAPLALASALALAGAAKHRGRPEGLWPIAAALACKYLDSLALVARYAACFALVGEPLSIDRAVFVAAVTQAVYLVPLAGNGLGLTEWAVEIAQPAGLIAALVNRAAELVVALPVGVAGTLVAARRAARPPAAPDSLTPAPPLADDPKGPPPARLTPTGPPPSHEPNPNARSPHPPPA